MLLLTLRHALKQSCHWSIAWSMKLCWFLTTFQSDAASARWRPSLVLARWRPSLVSDKHVPACRFQSVFPGSGALMWFSWSQRRKWMVHITVMSCCSTSVMLLHGDFCFPAHHACARALSCYGTRLRTSHQTWTPNIPDLSSVDYRLLRVIQECVLSETARDVKRRW